MDDLVRTDDVKTSPEKSASRGLAPASSFLARLNRTRPLRVLFSNPPWYEERAPGEVGWRGVRAGSRWPHTYEFTSAEVMDGVNPGLVGGYIPFPFWLATAGAYAKKLGFDAYTRDSIALGETYDGFVRFVTDYDPDILFIETASATVKHDLDLVLKFRAWKPSLTVIVAGLHIELEEPAFLKQHPEIDYIVYGEYEASAGKLLEALRDETPFADVPGLLWRDEAGEVQKTDFGNLVALDDLPWAEREDGVPALNYYDGVCGLPRPQLQLMSTRGCPYGCIFCVWPQMFFKGPKYRKRSVEDVVNEISENFAKVPYKSFYIDDDTFNLSKKNVLDLCRMIKERGLDKVPWGTMGRADLVDDEQLDALVDAGLFSVKYGVESADQGILDTSDKRIDLKRVISGIRKTAERGIKMHLTFTFGLPGDTPETIEKTIDLACELPCETLQFSIATPYPGTIMYDMYKEAGWLASERWEDYVGSTKAVSRTENFTPEQLEQYVKYAYRRFYEARQARKLKEANFETKLLQSLGEQQLRPGDALLVFQCANIHLTRSIVKTAAEAGYAVSIIAPSRFEADLADIVAVDKLHTFDKQPNFSYEGQKALVAEVVARDAVKAVVLPVSNDDGTGYEEIFALANLAPQLPKLKFTVNGAELP